MKLRIKGNSVRIRVTRSELDKLKTGGIITEETDFGTTALKYILQIADVNNLQASFHNSTITIQLPEVFARQWTETERVGFENNISLGNGKELYLLIEKDFKCLDETVEDQSDSFDNPLLAHNQ